MQRSFLAVALLVCVTACAAPPMRWEKPGGDAARDEADCRAAARQEAIRQLPYGDGPPVFGYPPMSMLQWTQAIDNDRSYLAEDLTRACMHDRGYARVPVSGTGTR
jgi:hypothetical protein